MLMMLIEHWKIRVKNLCNQYVKFFPGCPRRAGDDLG